MKNRNAMTFDELQKKWPVLDGAGFTDPDLNGWNGLVDTFMRRIERRYEMRGIPLTTQTFRLSGVEVRHQQLAIDVALCLCDWRGALAMSEGASVITCQACGLMGESILAGRWFVSCAEHAPGLFEKKFGWRIAAAGDSENQPIA